MSMVAVEPAWAGIGQVLAWGDNVSDQLGNCTSVSPVFTPAPVMATCSPNTPLNTIVKIAAGSQDALALLSTGAVMGWGDDLSICQTTTGTTSNAVVVPAPTNSPVKAIASGGGAAGGFTLFLLQNGTVWACGDNSWAELGDGISMNSLNSNPVPQEVLNFATGLPLTNVEAISAGFGYSLALLTNGTVMAWGNNQYGELGDGTMTGNGTCTSLNVCQSEATPVLLPLGDKARAIAAGGLHSLALLQNRTVMDWGLNYYGELGNGLYTGTNACTQAPYTAGTFCDPTPVAVPGLNSIVAIASGSVDSLALGKNGKVKVWGSDESGELGSKVGAPNSGACPNANNGDQCSSTPVIILNAASHPLKHVKAIAAGSGNFTDSDFNLALLTNGTVDAWGDNGDDQLGIPAVASTPTAGCGPVGLTEPCSNVPLAVAGLASVVAIAAQGGAGPFGLALE